MGVTLDRLKSSRRRLEGFYEADPLPVIWMKTGYPAETMAFASHGRGIEIGIRLAMAHPEYAAAIVQELDGFLQYNQSGEGSTALRIINKVVPMFPFERVAQDE